LQEQIEAEGSDEEKVNEEIDMLKRMTAMTTMMTKKKTITKKDNEDRER
jgi:hypothetical protein